MVVVRPQAVAVQSDSETIQGVAHQRFEVFIVVCFFEETLRSTPLLTI
jgi:hypothetical protein